MYRRHQIVRGQRERKKHWDSFCTLGTVSPKIRKKCPHHQNSRSLSCSHCPCNPCHCWLAWGVDWEWMERGFKIQECLYSFWPLRSLLSCFSDQKKTSLGVFLVCTQWVIPHFELPLNPSWVIPDGRDKQNKTGNPLLVWVLFWIPVSFLDSSATNHCTESSGSCYTKSLQGVAVFSEKDWVFTPSYLAMESLLIWKDLKCIVIFLCWWVLRGR